MGSVQGLAIKWLLPELNNSIESWCFKVSGCTEEDLVFYDIVIKYYNRILDCINATSEGDSIIFVGWGFTPRLDLKSGFSDLDSKDKDFVFQKANTLETVILQAAKRNVNVNILLTSDHVWCNTSAVIKNFRNNKNIKTYIDNQLYEFHQKGCFFFTKGTPILFLGGMDLHPKANDHIDVQLEIRGTSALLGAGTFYERINSLENGSLQSMDIINYFPFDKRKQFNIQFLRSYPSIDTAKQVTADILKVKNIESRNYAKYGDFTYYTLVYTALLNASKSIYIEDQFFDSMASNIQAPIPLIPNAIKRDYLPTTNPTLDNVLAQKANQLKNNFLVVSTAYRTNNSLPKTIRSGKTGSKNDAGVYIFNSAFKVPFIHSKILIIDDELIIIGSANIWINSYVNNPFMVGECGAAIVCDSTIKGDYFGFQNVSYAQGLRLRLWERLRQACDPLARLNLGNYNNKNSFTNEVDALLAPINLNGKMTDPFVNMP